jgi:hypothetical protein
MGGLDMGWWKYLSVCVVVPFVWGLVVHWIFSRLPERRRSVSPPGPHGASVPAVWDYHI